MSTSDSPAAAAAPIAADTQSNPPGEDGSSATACDASAGLYTSGCSRVLDERSSWGDATGGGLTALLWASIAC